MNALDTVALHAATFHTVALHAASGDLNTAGLTGWVKTHILPLAFVFLGTLVLIGAHRDKLSKNLGIGANVIFAGLLILGGPTLLLIGGAIADAATTK